MGSIIEGDEQGVGCESETFFASDYAGIIESIRFDKVDIAFLGAKAAIHAVDRSGGEVFAQTIDGRGRKGYYSILIVHKDSPINSLKDVLKCDKSSHSATVTRTRLPGSPFPDIMLGPSITLNRTRLASSASCHLITKATSCGRL